MAQQLLRVLEGEDAVAGSGEFFREMGFPKDFPLDKAHTCVAQGAEQ